MTVRIKEMIHNLIGMGRYRVIAFYSSMAWASFFTVLLFSPAVFAGTVTNLNDSGEGSLRVAVENASEGETLDFSVTGTIRLTDQIIIDKELTIRGPGQDILTIDGNSADRVFGIDSANVTLSGLTVSNGKPVNGDGNADDGGGIFNYKGNLTLENCTISGNTGKTGGGILNYQGTLALRNTTVSENNAEIGGGISNTVAEDNTSASAELTDSVVSQNTASLVGGGILSGSGASGATSSVTLLNCGVSGNTAQNGGGILSLAEISGSRSEIDISGSTFDQNQSTGTSEDMEAKNGGGGISSMTNAGATAAVNLSNSVFTGNSSAEVGGAVRHQAYGENAASVLTVSGCTFTQNVCNDAYYGGGAILNAAEKAGAKSDAVISNCKFLSNTAKGDGGALFNGSKYAGTATMKVTDTTVDGNTSTGVWGGGGVFSGAEIDEGGQPIATLEMSRCTLSNNQVEMAEEGHVGGGGAVRIGGNFANVTGTLTNCTVSGNQAVMAGGGIVSGGGDSPASLTLTNCTVTDNTSEDGGGIYAFDPVKMKNTIVAKNTATLDSGNDLSEYEAGLYASDGNNLIGDSTGSTGFANDVSGDIVGSASSPADPGLGPLQDNGGSTATHALLEDSPAINTGSDTEAPDSDQRGLGREQTDIGAYEYVVTEPGNIDGTGTTDLKDAILALKVTAGMPAGTISLNADVNRDRKIGLAEVIFILGKVSGLR
ncbi:choice-of-anchor Q domain-containing protein [Desulfonema magnum]|uniref:Probable pectate lyase C n=1 Tax=Desulfonema magnum TaxID=45655 RepID=A0A975BHP0_9BACT|nr:choice-of-anchor Q domain-containing protein [Desulfonema magnum]QTA85225.1 pectin lyase fold-containing [Desulfonema magnum]